jgi:hypothetical protein
MVQNEVEYHCDNNVQEGVSKEDSFYQLRKLPLLANETFLTFLTSNHSFQINAIYSKS